MKKMSLENLIKIYILQNTKPDRRTARNTAYGSKWKNLYANYKNTEQEDAFLSLSPYFFAKAHNIPYMDLMLKRLFRADLHKELTEAKYQSIQKVFCITFADENFSLYIEIHKPLQKEATPYELFSSISECHTSKLSAKRFKFDGYHFKKLDSNKGIYQEWVKFAENQEPREIIYTHELKINKIDRILFFQLQSDDNKACLFVGVRYIAGGLHTQAKINSLNASTKANNTFLTINWPC